MSYRIQEIDTAEPLPRIALDPGENGLALVIRRHGVPIGFHLEPLPPGSALEASEVTRLVDETVPTWRNAAPRPTRLAPAAPPSVTAVVCTRDRPELLARCLGSLRALRHGPRGRQAHLELLVVDNAPSDERTRDLVEGFPDVRYVREPLRGLDFARNRAWREARGDFVAYFDDDVTVDAGWLDGFVEACAEHPDTAGVTGPILPFELVTPAQVLFEEYGGFGHRFAQERFGLTRPRDPTYPCRPNIIGTGCNMALRRNALAAVGGFDEALDTGPPLPGAGDLDMLYRLVRAGHVIVTEPRCLVFHQHRRERRDIRYQMWTWGLGAMAFRAKTYANDPASRPKIRRLVREWAVHRVKVLAAWCLGRASFPLDIELAITLGGVVGLCGEYGRSCRRVARIREEAALAGAQPERARLSAA